MDVRVRRAGRCKLTVHNVAGERVNRILDQDMPVGNSRAFWAGSNEKGARVGNGVYYILFDGPDGRAVRKVIVLK
jgi:hypothetical protein